jgi:hypothetical protein
MKSESGSRSRKVKMASIKREKLASTTKGKNVKKLIF